MNCSVLFRALCFKYGAVAFLIGQSLFLISLDDVNIVAEETPVFLTIILDLVVTVHVSPAAITPGNTINVLIHCHDVVVLQHHQRRKTETQRSRELGAKLVVVREALHCEVDAVGVGLLMLAVGLVFLFLLLRVRGRPEYPGPPLLLRSGCWL
jgi:hypothetical protein